MSVMLSLGLAMAAVFTYVCLVLYGLYAQRRHGWLLMLAERSRRERAA